MTSTCFHCSQSFFVVRPPKDDNSTGISFEVREQMGRNSWLPQAPSRSSSGPGDSGWAPKVLQPPSSVATMSLSQPARRPELPAQESSSRYTDSVASSR
jgi:hypothetical protein